jgi:cytochrome c
MEAATHMMGPSLHGLMGRKVGSAPGFTFSPAMEQADFVWTDSTLSAFLENPMQYVPGTAMPFGGIRKSGQRAELVCYIKQQQ